ncbi:MAG: ABC transporter permease subunit [Promethearchaeota archaeon]|nr:MAG: ABC transporter permease subunit [Candidatus Lokiarchaeota archaeon]
METATLYDQEILDNIKKRDKPPKNTKFVVSLLIPALVIFGLAILFPIVTGIFISFRDSTGADYFGTRFTILNYWKILTLGQVDSRDFWQVTYQTLFFSVVSLLFEFVLGLVFALILNKNFKGRGIARATLLIPWAVPTIASATIFRFEIFNTIDEQGLINSLIVIFGGQPQSFFGADAPVLFNLPVLIPFSPYISEIEITMTMFTSIFIDVWKTTPFITLLILASLQIVPEDLYKAGDIAGATGWQKFRYITWPLIRPGVGVALIFRMMQALRVYDAIIVFNDSSVDSMTSYAVTKWLASDYGTASAISVMILLFICLFAVIIVLFTRREGVGSSGSLIKKIINRVKRSPDTKMQSEQKITHKDYIDEIVPLSGQKSILSLEPIKIEPISSRKIQWYIRKRQTKKVIFAILAIFMCLFCAVPFLWIVLRSFRNPDIIQTDFELFPQYLSFRAYEIIFQSSEVQGITFDQALLNGLILAIATVAMVLIVGALIAYAIAKFDFKFKKALNGFIFSMNSLPPLIIIIPFYIQMIGIAGILPIFDLRDNLIGLVLPYTAFNLPLAVFILIAFFREIPEDLWRAAKVDGASNFQIFRKVILPLTIPGIFTCAILVFIAGWNELLLAQIFLSSPENQTVPASILRYTRNLQTLSASWDTDIVLMAATSISTVPLVLVVLIFQKKIVSGLTRGAVKG